MKADIPKGYKQTEVGVIPEDWDTATLQDICVENGMVRGPFGGSLKKQFFVRDGIKVFEQKHAIYKSVEIGSYFITESKFNELKRFEVRGGDFIISCSGTIGRIYQIPEDAPEGIINQALLKIETDNNKIDDRYFSYYFEWEDFQNRIIESTQGGAMKNLVGMDVFRNTTIPLPPTIKEQQAIAEALSDVDGLIGSLDGLIAKKRQVKQGTMQQLLTGKRRLPGFSGEWEERKLGDFLDYEQPTNYLVKDTEYNDNNQIPVLTAGKSFILGYTYEAFGVFTELPVIIFDDFTTASKYVDFPFKAKSSAMKMLVPKNDKVHIRFIYEIMQLIKFPVGDHKRHWIGAYQHVDITVPSPEEQGSIAKVLGDMDTEIRGIEQERDKYKAIKQGMMQNLLTGRIRLI